MIKIGIADLVDRYVGTTPVQRVMQGTTQIWSKGAECIPLSGDAAIFLAAPESHTHTNSGVTLTMEDLPEDDVFPYGQKMFIGGYSPGTEVPNMAENGFTVAGSDYNVSGSYIESYIVAAKDAGLKCFVNLTRGHVGNRTNFNSWTENQAEIDTAKAKAKAEVERIYNMPYSPETVIGYNYGLDDYRMLPSCDNYAAQNQMYQAITQESERLYGSGNARIITEVSFATSYITTLYSTLLAYLDCTSAQSYFPSNYIGDGEGRWQSRYRIAKDSHRMSHGAELLGSPPNGRPRLLAPLSFGMNMGWSCIPGHGADGDSDKVTTDYLVKEGMHDALLLLMHSQNGLWYYQNKPANIQTPNSRLPSIHYAQLGLDSVYRVIKRLTDYNVTNALLWGEERAGSADGEINLVSVTSASDREYSGKARGQMPAEFDDDTFAISDGSHRYTKTDMLTWRSLQYKGKRFVIATNTNPTLESIAYWLDGDGCDSPYGAGPITPPANSGNFTIKFTGFPQNGQTKITEILGTKDNGYTETDKTTTSGEITVTLKPLQSVCYVVGPDDDHCGDDETTPETNVTFLATPTAFQTWVNGITGSAALIDIHYSNSRISNRSRGEFYAYETADYLVFYCPDGRNINANFDMQDFATICTVDDYSGGNYPGIPVGANQSIIYNAAGTMGGMIYSKTA